MRMSNTVQIPNQPLLIASPHSHSHHNDHHIWGGDDGDGYMTMSSKYKNMMNKSVGSRQKFKYMECLKNHAAAIGGSATDGCGEFMPSGEEGSLEALKCEACNCHRNFHRKSILPIQQPQRKRARSKFSQDQKEKMQRFAEKAEWKIHKVDDAELRSFCQEIGVNTKVLKVWMHNNKYNNHLLPTNPLS